MQRDCSAVNSTEVRDFKGVIGMLRFSADLRRRFFRKLLGIRLTRRTSTAFRFRSDRLRNRRYLYIISRVPWSRGKDNVARPFPPYNNVRWNHFSSIGQKPVEKVRFTDSTSSKNGTAGHTYSERRTRWVPSRPLVPWQSPTAARLSESQPVKRINIRMHCTP